MAEHWWKTAERERDALVEALRELVALKAEPNGRDARRALYDHLSMEFAGRHPLDAMLPEICQLIDACKMDWQSQGAWTEWDQSVRERIMAYNLSRLGYTPQRAESVEVQAMSAEYNREPLTWTESERVVAALSAAPVVPPSLLGAPASPSDSTLQQPSAASAAIPGAEAMSREVRMSVMLAYGHLWHVNNEPAAPIPLYLPEKAAYAARVQLRDLLTTQERGEAINQVGFLIGRYDTDARGVEARQGREGREFGDVHYRGIVAAVKNAELDAEMNRILTMPEAQIDTEIRAEGGDPDDYARRGKAAFDRALERANEIRDAARYRWLRKQNWFDGALCVVRDPRTALTSGVGLGADCPSLNRLDDAIDAAMAGPGAPAGATARIDGADQSNSGETT